MANINYKSFKHKAKILGSVVTKPAPNAVNGILENCNCHLSSKYLITVLEIN